MPPIVPPTTVVAAIAATNEGTVISIWESEDGDLAFAVAAFEPAAAAAEIGVVLP